MRELAIIRPDRQYALEDPNILFVEALAGSQINQVCEQAITLAKLHGKRVRFDFNGVWIEAASTSTVEDLVGYFRRELDKNSEAYAISPEGRQAAADREIRAKNQQKTVDELLAKLDEALGCDASLVDWLGKFADPADHTDVKYDKKLLIQKMEGVGYVRNEFVGHSDVSTDARIFAHWLVGQVLDCLYANMGPHPVTIKFANEYASKFGVGRMIETPKRLH